ncbi:MAG: aldo/keto reductase [Caulobacteraceae bacterium]
MTDQPTVTLNDGCVMPQCGLGVWQTPDDHAPAVIRAALDAGYRLVDTAAIYGNERGVGEGLRTSGLSRGDVFVTTKLWNDRQGYDSALQACAESLAKLGLDYLDLYLIHWPVPQQDRYVDSWRALVELQRSGRVRSIGVSNFNAEQIDRLIGETGVTPAVNQIELHPAFQQADLRAAHAARGIATESWSPLGRGHILAERAIVDIAAKHGKTPAQVIIRWHLDNGLIVIPKSVRKERLHENFAVFDFTLDADDLARMTALDSPAGRTGPDPANFP